MNPEIRVDVEAPYQEIYTISWAIAAKKYDLDDMDLTRLKSGKVVWAGDVGITLHEGGES